MLTFTVIDVTERLKQEDLKVRVSYCSESFSSIFGVAYWQVFFRSASFNLRRGEIIRLSYA